MIITKIELENFRSFYGKQVIELSEDKEKNITLILAENGSGKTNLLNSIRMCFHNKHSSNFRNPEDIINQKAKSEGQQVAKVSLWLNYEDCQYHITRTWSTIQQSKNFGSEIVVNKIIEGSYEPQRSAESIIQKMFPQSMASNFAFDGEGAVRMTDNKEALQASTKEILGTQHIEIALDDLKKIKTQIQKDINKNSIEDEERVALNELTKIDGELEVIKSKIDNIKKEKNATEENLSMIENSLRGKDLDTGPILSEIKEKKNQLIKKQNDLIENRKEKIIWLNDNARAILSSRMEELTSQFFVEAKKAGKLPYTHTKPFVEKIVSDKVCICGRPFEIGTDEHSKISSLLDSAGETGVQDDLNSASNVLKSLTDKRKLSNSGLNRIMNKELQINVDISELEDDIREKEANLKLAGDQSGLTEKIEKRDSLKKDKDRLTKEQGVLEFTQEDLIKTQRIITQKIKEYEALKPKNDLLSKKFTIVTDLIDQIQLMTEYETEIARNEIEDKINTILAKTLRKNYTCKINKEFNMQLVSSATGESATPSDGEAAFLTLTFVSSLIDFCKDRKNDNKELLINGVSAPMILDAPYSNLDRKYTEAVSNFIPEMSEQVILMLKADSFKGVEDKIKDRIGNIYTATILTNKNIEDQNFNVYGKQVYLLKGNSDFIYTNLEKVDYA